MEGDVEWIQQLLTCGAHQLLTHGVMDEGRAEGPEKEGGWKGGREEG